MTMQRMMDDPRTDLLAEFRGIAVVEDAPVQRDLPASPAAADAVKWQCSRESLGNAFANAVDGEGRSAPGRMVQQFNRLRLLGDGVLSWKDSARRTVSELTGVIVRVAPPHRSLWTEGNLACASLDSVRGYGNPGIACAECSYAKWVEDADVCKSRSRVYIAEPGGNLLTLMDLTAMTREGLAGLSRYCKQEGLAIPQLECKFSLDTHPRQMQDAKFAIAILKCEPIGIADDRSQAYAKAIEYANAVLARAEHAWLEDIAQPAGYEQAVVEDGSGLRSDNRLAPPAETSRGALPSRQQAERQTRQATPQQTLRAQEHHRTLCVVSGNPCDDPVACRQGCQRHMDVNELPF